MFVFVFANPFYSLTHTCAPRSTLHASGTPWHPGMSHTPRPTLYTPHLHAPDTPRHAPLKIETARTPPPRPSSIHLRPIDWKTSVVFGCDDTLALNIFPQNVKCLPPLSCFHPCVIFYSYFPAVMTSSILRMSLTTWGVGRVLEFRDQG